MSAHLTKARAKDAKPQHQGSLYDQLQELLRLATKDGLYDAADWIQRHLETIDRRKSKVTP